MQVIKHSIKYILTFVITLLCLAGGLVLCAKIPQEAIKPKVQESAVYLCEGKLFGELVKGVEGSKIDRYADSILLAIAYQYDDDDDDTTVPAAPTTTPPKLDTVPKTGDEGPGMVMFAVALLSGAAVVFMKHKQKNERG